MSSTLMRPKFSTLFRDNLEYNVAYLTALASYNNSVGRLSQSSADSLCHFCGSRSESNVHCSDNSIDDIARPVSEVCLPSLHAEQGQLPTAEVVVRGKNYLRNLETRRKNAAKKKAAKSEFSDRKVREEERRDLENQYATLRLRQKLVLWDSSPEALEERRKAVGRAGVSKRKVALQQSVSTPPSPPDSVVTAVSVAASSSVSCAPKVVEEPVKGIPSVYPPGWKGPRRDFATGKVKKNNLVTPPGYFPPHIADILTRSAQRGSKLAEVFEDHYARYGGATNGK